MDAKPMIVVTGASRGIGAAVCRKLAQAGHPVAVNYAASRDAAEQLVAEILAAGGRAAAFPGDIGREADIVGLFAAAEAALGPLGGLVNNAGITGPLSRVADITPAILERVLAVNVTGCFLAAREAIRRLSTKMGGKGGAIVNIASRAAGLGGAGEWVHYAASKGAVETFTIGLAREVAGEGIRVNAVSPGLIDTDIHASAGAPDRVARLAPGVPLGRAGSADEVADAVQFLLSAQAAYITGAILPVSGGR